MTPLCLAYTRVSTDRQDLSTEAQHEQVRRAATFMQLPDPEVFADSDTSGSTPFLEREEASELMQHIERELQAGNTITLLVPKLDRLGRDAIDVMMTVRKLDQIGVRLCILNLGGGLVDTKTAMGRFFVAVAASFAELELGQIRERIQSALDHKKSKGELCGTVPFGWDAVETGATTAKGVKVRKLVDNPAEQAWIRQMAEWRAAGWSYGRIAKMLNEQGVKTKKASLTPQPSHLTPPQWQQGNVHKVLTNSTVTAWLALPRGEQAA